MGNLSPWELLLIAGVLILLFGAKKLPEMARSLGKAKGEFKKGLDEGDAERGAKGGADPGAKAGANLTAKTQAQAARADAAPPPAPLDEAPPK